MLRQIIRRRGAAATAAAANADTAEEDASANLSVDSTAKEGPVESTALSIADGCVVVRPIPLNDTGTTAAEWNAEQEQDTEDGTGVSSRDVVADAKRQSGEFGASSHCDLNRSMVSTSSASSVGSPFCSPVARYQHYSFGASSSSKKKNSSSSKNAARAPSPAAAVVAESDFAAFGSGGESSSGKQGGVPSSSGSGGSGEEQPRLRQQQQQRQEAVIGVKSGVYSKSPGRDCNNGANQVPGSGGAVLQISSPTPSGGNSAAESRARVLGSLLYSTVNGSGKAAGVGCGRKASTELVPVSPPLVPSAASRSNSITAISSTGIAGSPSSSLPMKIPVPAPIKKVTSHTSISSSYGSTGYLASSYFYNRSRSASKADETGGVDYDIRLLLGDSPVVPVPLVQANVDANYGFYAFSDGNTACSPNAASTGNSNCNSRTRSRCSSFNPPYAAGASAASNISNSNSNFNNNLNTAITESSVLHRLASGTSLYYVGSGGGGGGVMDPSPTSSADSSPADKLKGAFAAAVVAASGSGSGKLGTYSAGLQVGGTSSSAAGSVASSRETATSAPLFDSPRGSIAARGSRNTARSRSSSLGNSYTFQQTNERISAAVSSTSVDKELFPTVVAVVDADCSREPEEGEGVSEGEGLGLFEGAPPPSSSSPVPSFASSLSSTDSMSNMLDLLLSPAGRAQERRRRERESRGERDGVGIGLQGLDGDRGGLLGDDDGAEDAEGLEGSYGYSFGAYGDGDGDWDGGVLADAGAQADLGLLPE